MQHIKLITIIILLFASNSFAAITFDANGKWETTFDCTEQFNNNTIGDPFSWDCDDIGEGTDNFGVKFDLSDGSTDNWTQSTAYPNQYYYSGALLVAPNEAPEEVTLDNVACLGSTSYPKSSPLSAYEFSYEDVEAPSIGTKLYVYSLVDPDSQVSGYVAGWFEHTYYNAGDTQTSIITAANNPLGTGRGARFWKGDAKNGPGNQSMSVTFPSAQKELWIRWYSNYQLNFNWRSMSQDKMIYLHTTGTSHFLGFYSNEFDKFRITSQEGGAYTYEGKGLIGWDDVMVAGTDGPSAKRSDGKYHCYEIHLKMDTGETLGVPNFDGVAEIWIDGILAGSNKTAYLSYQLSIDGSNADSVLGWKYFTFDSNQDFVENLDFYSMDWDDMVIISDPENSELKDDGNGNLFIGPIPTGTEPVVVLQADFSTSTAPTTYTGTATASTGRTITGVVSSNGYTVTPDDGVWDELEEAFTVSGVLPTVTDTCTATDSSAETGQDSITVTLTSVSSGTTLNGWGAGRFGR